jgi:hypothetical protein
VGYVCVREIVVNRWDQKSVSKSKKNIEKNLRPLCAPSTLSSTFHVQ